MVEASVVHPDWNQLYAAAAAQEGLFTTHQAANAGYSPQLLVHYLHIGRAIRLRRGLYRLVHFPTGEHEDLVETWLWSEQAGVISHETALALHGLSDVLPSHIHLTLPVAWKRRRLRVPPNVTVHHADVPTADRTWFGAAPTTNPRRTLDDCAVAGLSPELLLQATQQALHRGLVGKNDLNAVEKALKPFGGIVT
jgi:predicted transcriptional regulator of viral defense system